MSGPGIAARLEERAVRLSDPSCASCRGLGIVFDPQGAGKGRGAFTLCKCMEKIVRAPEPPYEYYDEERNLIAPCPARPARLAIERIESLVQRANIPPRYQGNYLEAALYQADRDGDATTMMALDNAIETVRSAAGESPYGLFIYGPPGSGKTHLACIVLNEIIRLYRKQVLFAKVHRDVIARVKSSFNQNSEDYGQARSIEEELRDIPVLVLDDLGIKETTPFENQLLYDIIDSRYDYNRLTLITSNESIDAFKDVAQGRITSRLRAMCREVHLETADHRLKHAL